MQEFIYSYQFFEISELEKGSLYWCVANLHRYCNYCIL